MTGVLVRVKVEGLTVGLERVGHGGDIVGRWALIVSAEESEQRTTKSRSEIDVRSSAVTVDGRIDVKGARDEERLSPT